MNIDDQITSGSTGGTTRPRDLNESLNAAER
jgi:hypothetical protein